jgi:ADP-ribosylglycohydrolase
MGTHPQDPAAPQPPTHPSRVLGCLLGGAVGDAFGYEVEFSRLPEIRHRFGPRGMLEPVRHGGRLVVSDDTQMTLFTLEGLVRAQAAGCLADIAATLEHIRLATLDWYLTQSTSPRPASFTGTLGRARLLQARRAPGNTCLSACAQGATGTPERPINDSKGCGGVMRVAPIGLVRTYTVAQAFELAARAAAQTHGHPEGFLPSGCMAAIVRGLVEGQGLAEATAGAVRVLAGWPRAARTLEAVAAAQAPGATVAGLGEGWVGEEALAIGLHAALVAERYEDAVRLASNHDGDSDSTASVAGQLVGAWKGAGAIPAAWAEGLDCGAELTKLASDLA